MFKNKAWKSWKTRKLTFIYCLGIGTLAILFGAIMMCLGKDFQPASWLELTLNFCKFVVGTGTAIIIAPNFTSLVKILKGDSTIEEEIPTTDEETYG